MNVRVCRLHCSVPWCAACVEASTRDEVAILAQRAGWSLVSGRVACAYHQSPWGRAPITYQERRRRERRQGG